jgi:hypothetical protein
MRHFVNGSLALVVLLGTASLGQADGVRDASSKMRGDYEHIFQQNNNSSGPVYRAATPAAAPVAVAEAPNARRSFSAEGRVAQPGNSAATAQAPTQPRRFSYDPATTSGAPSTARTSPTPNYLLPKSDPNKFRIW